MFMSVRHVAVLACAVLAPAAGALAAQDAEPALVVESTPEAVTLRFDEEGAPLAEVLRAFSALLQQPIDFLPDEVAANRVRVDGPQVIARDKLRDALDSLLERHGFWCWDDVSGGSTQLVVRQRYSPGSRSGGLPPFTPRIISLEELEAGPEPRAPLYVVVFQLQHLSGRNLMTVISSSFDGTSEKVRITDGNALVVQASRDHLLYLRDLLKETDHPAPDAPAVERIASLEQQLAAFEQRLAALEARLAALEPAPAK